MNQESRSSRVAVLLMLLFLIAASATTVGAQSKDTSSLSDSAIRLNRSIGKAKLRLIVATLRREYYDREFGGISLEDRQKKALEAIEKNEHISDVFFTLAQFLLEFKDSHTRFFPPTRKSYVAYGFNMQLIGDKCFVTSVKRGSDAEKKGLKVGDEIETIAGFVPNRDSLSVIRYLLWRLQPREEITLSVNRPDGTKLQTRITSTFLTNREIDRIRREARNSEFARPYTCKAVSDDLIACKLRTFLVEEREIDSMMREVGDHKKLILDLRGNAGGYVRTTLALTNHFFSEEVLVGTEKTRHRTVQLKAKGKGDRAYKGELVVLVDSSSSSGSEVFSRVVQIEQRGKIVGDITSGSVTIGRNFQIKPSLANAPYVYDSLISVTVADIVMSDGNRIENVGVVPNFFATPTAGALAQKIDPVLMYASELIKSPMSIEKASELEFLFNQPDDANEQ